MQELVLSTRRDRARASDGRVCDVILRATDARLDWTEKEQQSSSLEISLSALIATPNQSTVADGDRLAKAPFVRFPSLERPNWRVMLLGALFL